MPAAAWAFQCAGRCHDCDWLVAAGQTACVCARGFGCVRVSCVDCWGYVASCAMVCRAICVWVCAWGLISICVCVGVRMRSRPLSLPCGPGTGVRVGLVLLIRRALAYTRARHSVLASPTHAHTHTHMHTHTITLTVTLHPTLAPAGLSDPQLLQRPHVVQGSFLRACRIHTTSP